VVSLAGTNAVAVRLVLKEWKIPFEAVNLLVVGGSPTQLAALESGTIDAAVLTYGVTKDALRKGMTVLADHPSQCRNFLIERLLCAGPS
jgi:ABC-type nitrate/sulfonate/bicarbonate transport system substrate-binding protein